MHNPPHSGAVLHGLYMEPLGLSVSELPRALGISRKAMSQVVNSHARVTPYIALRLARAFENTPEGWMSLQAQRDLWKERAKTKVLHVRVIHKAGSDRLRA